MSGIRRNPVARSSAMVIAGPARFTVLTPELIRVEWTADGVFEDRASQFVVNRRTAPCPWKKHRNGPSLTITTPALELQYRDDGHRFHKGNLTIRRHDWPKRKSWNPSRRPKGNLRGTARTLDEVSGATKLEPGVISRDGWAIVDDSERLVFEPDCTTGWLMPRRSATGFDWYFFGHGHDYKKALGDFTLIAGRQPMVPRFALGLWWSRYWAYTDDELKQIVREHSAHDVPLDVLVVDMDWHVDGWTGYTWNPKYFPDPDGFLQWCHDEKLKVTLNLHPADGVGSHEARFKQFVRAMDVNAGRVDRIAFDCADPKFMSAYFKVLHHPLERQGVDFWWIDWQQGSTTSLPGLDPLWQLNEQHWRDMETRASKRGVRPLILSRWAGLGNHRYPIGFSGDTHSDWDSLAFQPYFTATASNVAYGFWSHDIGGHYPGKVDGELYLRWIQLGALSPILRMHTTRDAKAERRLWKFPKIFRAAREAIRLRYRLLPYIETAVHQAHETGVSLCRPMHYDWPEHDEAYEHRGQYMFGNDLLTAPVVRPVNRRTKRAGMQIWFPPGEWRDFQTGELIRGGRVLSRSFGLSEIPLFVRAGTIVPTAMPVLRIDDLPREVRRLRVYAGDVGESELYEDDGTTIAYQRGGYATTTFSLQRHGKGGHIIEIGATCGQYDGMLGRCRYELELFGFGAVRSVHVNGRNLGRGTKHDGGDRWSLHGRGARRSIQLAERCVYTGIRIEIESRK